MARLPGSKNKIRRNATTLTLRETEIVQLLLTGAPSKEIAAVLHISTATVRTHLKQMYAKLGVHNRVEALNKTRWLTASPQPAPAGTAATETLC